MKLSTISTAVVFSVAVADVLRIDEDKLEFSATIPVNSKDTFEHNGEEIEIVRTRNEEPNIIVPLGLESGQGDPTLVKDAYVAGETLQVTVSGAVIKEQSISGSSYAVENLTI